MSQEAYSLLSDVLCCCLFCCRAAGTCSAHARTARTFSVTYRILSNSWPASRATAARTASSRPGMNRSPDGTPAQQHAVHVRRPLRRTLSGGTAAVDQLLVARCTSRRFWRSSHLWATFQSGRWPA